MSGPEHYREAAKVVEQAKNRDLPVEIVTAYAAVAQVHATLALAAAMALGREGNDLVTQSRDRAQWLAAAADPILLPDQPSAPEAGEKE